MPKQKVQIKQMGLGKAQDMAKVFSDIFKPNSQNIHIYIDKILQLQSCYKRIATILNNANKTFANQQMYTPARHQLNAEDKQVFQTLKTIKDRIKQEIIVGDVLSGTNPKVNSVSMLMYSKYKDWLNPEDVQPISTYFNGQQLNTFTNRIVSLAGEFAVKLKGIKNHSITNKDSMQSFLITTQKEYSGMLYVENYPLDLYIEGLRVLEGQERDSKFATLFMTLQMLNGEFEKLYKCLKIPEFDVSQIKDLIETAIKEFKKQLPQCNLAFKKLLSSLDVFVDNFDNYYETFNSNGKEPLVLLTGFIDDVQQQYKDADNAECRKLLREFKLIQLEFSKRLGAQSMNNPIIKTLFDQLSEQLATADKLVGKDETQPEEEKKHEE